MNIKINTLDFSSFQLQEAIEDLDTKKNLQNLAALAAEVLVESNLSTKWDDIVQMVDSENISERPRLAAHIIFRAKLILDEIDRNPLAKNLVFNTMLMMDALEVSNLKGYLNKKSYPNFQEIDLDKSSMNSALKKERLLGVIKGLRVDNPGKGITWLRKEASKLLTSKGYKGYSYRQIMRDTKGLTIN